MKSYELVSKAIRGECVSKTPVYGWVRENLTPQITERFGSVEAFEDYYEFDMAHLFGGPLTYDMDEIARLVSQGIEITPDVLLQMPVQPVNDMDDYRSIVDDLNFYRKERGRFCYIHTNGIFEQLNSVFGIENHLCYLALYPDELREVYKRQAEWNRQFAINAIELGVDMIHVSDDWGAQRSLLFSKRMFGELIAPYHKITADAVKMTGTFLSIHSDGCIKQVLDDVVALGYDAIHPWQETAGMDYQTYCDSYANKLSIFGGLCIQSTLGFGD